MSRAANRRWLDWNRRPRANPVVVTQDAVREKVPMTPAQVRFLKALCFKTGETFNPTWSKAQASRRIRQLKRRA